MADLSEVTWSLQISIDEEERIRNDTIITDYQIIENIKAVIYKISSLLIAPVIGFSIELDRIRTR